MGRFRRSGSFSGRSAAPRRQIFNQAITGEVDGAVPLVGKTNVLGSVGIASGEAPVTLVRTRGRWTARYVTFPASVANTRVVLGMLVISADAFAAGVGSIPDPVNDPENDWFVWEPLVLSVGTAAAEGTLNYDIASFDSRGMRKLKLGDILVVSFGIESDVAGGTLDMAYALRQQFKT